MVDVRIKKADLIGRSRSYEVEVGDELFKVNEDDSGSYSIVGEDKNSVRNIPVAESIDEFKKALFSEITASVNKLRASSESIVGQSQLCSLFVYGFDYARLMEPLYREVRNGNDNVADIDNDGKADLAALVTSGGTEVLISSFDVYSLTKKSYLEFRCAEPDGLRKGVEGYLSRYDTLFVMGLGGLFHSLVKVVAPIEPFVSLYFTAVSSKEEEG